MHFLYGTKKQANITRNSRLWIPTAPEHKMLDDNLHKRRQINKKTKQNRISINQTIVLKWLVC